MSIQSIKDAKFLREQGARLKRPGMSERVDVLVKTPKAAMHLAGHLHAQPWLASPS